MPVITIKGGKTSPAKKKELVEKITNTAVEVLDYPASSYTVFIEEYDDDSCGVGGQTITELMASKK